MSDIRHLDITATDKGIKTNTLIRNAEALTAGSANNKEYFGFYVNAVGGDWSYTPIDGNAAITFTPEVTTFYPFHCSAITPHASGTGFGDLGGFKNNLVDAISTMTFTGTATVTNDILTVAVGNSATLNSDSAVVPLVGQTYEYTIVINNYTAATTATMSMGGVEIYNKGATGTHTGTFTATAVTDFAIVVDTVATEDFVVGSIVIKRVI